MPRLHSRRHRPAARRPGPAPGSRPAPVWLFDLDNTLHRASHAIFPAINEAMTRYIIEALGVERPEADRLRLGYVRRYGATLLGLARHHPIDPHEFLRVAHTLPELGTMLRAERGVARLVAALPGRKIVLTNAPEAYATAVLDELGLTRLFERVIAIEHMRRRGRWHAKPDLPMLRHVLRGARVDLARAVLVEDTRGHLKRYRRLGIGTVWIVGHLLAPAAKSGGPARVPGTGRPHYVDRRIRSLKSLRRVTSRSGYGVD
ncbi:pyrimidine 5'-nucleotidase [Trinickia caryophylli]|uniref:Pyrimidine 5'-nucleotidase n=1 Tax=Trinickia caryophylli TaxID=28094 RepID=A0A1X7FA26_TRICW|nr:pyrimidine 5'-nucleotidase [Trinickia caryophylli]PMS10962.1 pyrimidine 5'-nucleotidase [Trinickia caryophylli]TRX18911.1 pyrimidine 5'-nucleotidase [Trinickia caryophylli]WQE10290.1 pyrimidine 5'-nucleotidase [Trinickia caryophylli]SMF48860.1 pyrimidine 5'-nucleotidase [Trinickia caryophylli]GLU34263.1 pyrimidine 5'-nucleotidase [Trinickia caryophylli]